MNFEDSVRLEHVKAQLAADLERSKSAAVTELEMYKGRIVEKNMMADAARAYAVGAMQGLLLVNGGAAVAVMSLLGSLSKGRESQPIVALSARPIGTALSSFGIGLAAAVLALGLSYVSQVVIREASERVAYRWGGGIRISAATAALASLIAFIAGISQARGGMTFVP